MIDELKPYPAYKDSGVPWLGQMPEHWIITRLKSQLIKNDSGVWGDAFQEDGTFVLRSTEQTITGGWRIFAPARIQLSQSQRESALLEEGDLVVTKSSGSSAHIGKTSLVNKSIAEMKCCHSNFMQRLRLKKNTTPSLVWRFLNSPIGREQMVFHSTTTTGLGNLNGTILGNCIFAFPPLPEQTAIVRFLDYADRRIRRYIRAKQKLIKLLEEQKQAIIHQAVTRGLDPNVRLKPSGVEWLGDVPEHWAKWRLKNLLRPIDRRSATGTETLLSLRRDHGIVVYSEHFSRPHQGATLVGYKLVETENIVVNRLQANNGLIFRSSLCGLVSPDYSVFEPLSFIDGEYLTTLLRTVLYRTYFRQVSTGLGTGSSGFLRLYDDKLLGTPIFLPSIIEQIRLLSLIAEKNFTCEASIVKTQHEISLLQEYRTRLIADVVTGKLDVREVAARLPEEGDEIEVIDEAEVLEDVGEEMADDLEAISEEAAE